MHISKRWINSHSENSTASGIWQVAVSAPKPAYQWQRSRIMLWAVEDRVIAPEPSASPRESESFVMRKSRKLNPTGYDQDA